MSTTLTRQQLYDRVWAAPIDKLCKEFGISNVGLGKACRRHGIPVPPRGYWQRKAAGYADRRPALPKLTARSEIITLLGSLRSESPAEEEAIAVHPLIAFERQAENRVVVPDGLRSKHPAIKQSQEYWAAQKRGEVTYGENKLPHLNIRVSLPILPRALSCCRRCLLHSSSAARPLTRRRTAKRTSRFWTSGLISACGSQASRSSTCRPRRRSPTPRNTHGCGPRLTISSHQERSCSPLKEFGVFGIPGRTARPNS